MTAEEKTIKKYMAAVRRRLNLPREQKHKAMEDLADAIRARREEGMTASQILEELGPVRKAAADINEKMKEFAYRKSPWRYLFAAVAVYGAVELLGAAAAGFVYLALSDPFHTAHETASIGIIGGADGPTAILVATPGWFHWAVPALLLCGGILGYLRLSRCKGKAE